MERLLLFFYELYNNRETPNVRYGINTILIIGTTFGLSLLTSFLYDTLDLPRLTLDPDSIDDMSNCTNYRSINDLMGCTALGFYILLILLVVILFVISCISLWYKLKRGCNARSDIVDGENITYGSTDIELSIHTL